MFERGRFAQSSSMFVARGGPAVAPSRGGPRPMVLLTVYGVFLVVVGITTTALATLVSAHFSNAALNEAVGSDAGTIRTFANLYLLESDLGPTLDPARRTDLSERLEALVRNGNVTHLEIRLPDGTVVASEDASLAGRRAGSTSDFAAALGGSVAVRLVSNGDPTEAGVDLAPHDVLREYLPVSAGNDLRAVVGVWRDAAPILRGIGDIEREVVIVSLTGALVAAIFLFLVFRAAQARISRQTVEIVEATRHDPVTGLMNHGAILALLAERMETARQRNEPIGIGLIDIDGFRLLNETHGHEAGDSALRTVATLVRRTLDPGTILGRSGPDEFLVVVEGADLATIEPAIQRLESLLTMEALTVDESERLPIGVSAGIAAFPADADSPTALLAKAAQSLAEAKASGGGAIRVAGRPAVGSAEVKTFDVFQGLILAIDTKDRYTKRHCHDVAAYSVFLGRLLGQDAETVRTIQVAALLHDVGKIGIPDSILRKPGRLTQEETRVVQQHVVLGDMIVRDLPNIDLIRAGVRHHHERWDGRGYLEALSGDDIPLVARILAVGDAFSAMTTTRPYRKALSVGESLRRLEDAAGAQLDERLVKVFVDGLRTEPDAPLPGATEMRSLHAWPSADRVA